MGRRELSKYFFSKDQTLILAGALLFLFSGVINHNTDKPIIVLEKQDTAINIDNNVLLFINAGNKRLFTDLIWVQTLIESDLERYNKKDLNNWLYHRFNTISVLDPKFYENYLYGGQFLGIVKDDLEGADSIYSKGVAIYPDDYYLNYYAGFLNYYEMGEFEKGYTYLSRVADHPKAPVFIKSIIHKLKLENGAKLEDIYELVTHHLNVTKDEALRTKLKSDLYTIKAEIDLKCLNNNLKNCSLIDLDGNPYLKDINGYKTSKFILPYRINQRGKTESPSPQKATNTFK